MNITDVLTPGGLEGSKSNLMGKEGAIMNTDSLLFALFLQNFTEPSALATGQAFEESLSDYSVPGVMDLTEGILGQNFYQAIFQNLFPAGKEANSGSNGEQAPNSISQHNPMFHTGQQDIYQSLLEELLPKDNSGGFMAGGTAQTALNGNAEVGAVPSPGAGDSMQVSSVDSTMMPLQDSPQNFLKQAESQSSTGIQQLYPRERYFGQAQSALQTIGPEGISGSEVKILDPVELEKYRNTAEQFQELSGKIELVKNQKADYSVNTGKLADWTSDNLHAEKQLMTGVQPTSEKQLIPEKQLITESQPVFGKQAAPETQSVLKQQVSAKIAVPENILPFDNQANTRSSEGKPGINPGVTPGVTPGVNHGMNPGSEPAPGQGAISFFKTASQGESGQELSSGDEGQEKGLAHSFKAPDRISAQASALEQVSEEVQSFVIKADDVSPMEKPPESKDLGMLDQARVWDQVLAVLKKQDLKDQALKELSLKLHPAELGKVDVSLKLENGLIHVTMNASEQATSQMLQNHLQDLRAGLAEMGVSCGSLELGYSQDNNQLNSGRDNYPDSKGPAGYSAEEENMQALELNWYTQLTGAGSRINVSA